MKKDNMMGSQNTAWISVFFSKNYVNNPIIKVVIVPSQIGEPSSSHLRHSDQKTQ